MWTRNGHQNAVNTFIFSALYLFCYRHFVFFQLDRYYDCLAIDVLLQTGCQGQFLIWALWSATQGGIYGGAA